MDKIPWSYRIGRLTWYGIDLLFPPVCAGCGMVGSPWCQNCQAGTLHIAHDFCRICGLPMGRNDICDRCKSDPPLYRMMRSWAVFEFPVQNALHSLKYRRNVGFGDALAKQITGFVRSMAWKVDLLVPVPLGKKRLKQRGYNQVGLVARPLAYQTGVKYAPNALRKSRETRSQVGLSVPERRENVSGAFLADPKVVNRKAILLMDDVATTGATIQSCTQALLGAGAQDVYALTIARALSHHDLNRV